jgi:signal transduction histidine kinase
MRLHGGDLVLVASTGAGTIFRITMPAVKTVAKVANREKEPAT